jgi:2-polyprenyl-3-methyl-5-hydroxy-6-metoxy-1,4-benzoquinol methylase
MVDGQIKMREEINIKRLEGEYLRHTDYHLFPGGRKRLQVIMELGERRSRKLGRRLRVLDVGCGNGSNSFPLASLGHDLLGIDISADSIHHAALKNPFPNARFRVHNLVEKSLDETFDLVLCSEVLEHLTNPEPLLLAMARVLEPGGLLLITVPNGYGPREVLGRIEIGLNRNRSLQPLLTGIRRLLRMSSADEKCRMHTSNPDQDHVQKFTPGQLRRLIESGGLNITGWVNSFWLLSLFGKAQAGTNFAARIDSWLADHGPKIFSSGWYVISEKKRPLAGEAGGKTQNG